MQSLQNVTLFRQTKRTDPHPARYGEDNFSFLDRVDQKFWDRVRSELERWFTEYPVDEAIDLRARFQDKDPSQHRAAWWELYVFRLFSQLGFHVEVHPKLVDGSGRPDFRVTGSEGSFLVEAATTFSGIANESRDSTREDWIKAAIEVVHAPHFRVGLSFEETGMERPSVREIVAPVEAWLSTLDPDDHTEPPGLGPERQFQIRDWKFNLTALPVKPESRGRPDHRVLGFDSGRVGAVNDTEMLKRTLESKRRKYGKPEEPLVFAVSIMSPTVDNEDIEEALLGSTAWQFDPERPHAGGEWIRQRNGFWMKGGRARGTRVSAVIIGTGLLPWTVATTWPRLWPNPWATHPLLVKLPFPNAVTNECGTVAYEDQDRSPAATFDLPDDWPGPEGPFERGTSDPVTSPPSTPA